MILLFRSGITKLLQKRVKKSSIKAMASLLIKGLGNKKLKGELSVFGAKNSVLKAQAASLLFKDKVLLRNVPFIEDVAKMNNLLKDLGVIVEQSDKRSFIFKAPKIIKSDFNSEIAKTLRSSIVLVGPVLAREGRVVFPHPGGCVIGQRPIDIFLDAFQKMGAKLEVRDSSYVLTAKKLKGSEIFFKIPSVTATETFMMTAVLASGTTVLYNCACEPEVAELAEFLNFSGANIKGAGTHSIVIKGGNRLEKGTFKIPPDRIEAGSFAIIAALCGKDLKITNCQPLHMGATIQLLKEMGVNLKVGKNSILVDRSGALKPVKIKTREYPGFSTDLQAPFSVLLTQARGRSFVFETVFEGRLNYLNDLARMGADVIICDPHRAIINGPTELRSRKMESLDLRAGLSFVIAAMIANGSSVVDNVYNIDRGYEKIEERLNNVGADIRRVFSN